MMIIIKRYPKLLDAEIKVEKLDTVDWDEICNEIDETEQQGGNALVMFPDEAIEVMNEIKKLKL